MDRPIANPGSTLLTASVRGAGVQQAQTAPRGLGPGLNDLAAGLGETGQNIAQMKDRQMAMDERMAEIHLNDAKFRLGSLGTEIEKRAQEAATAAGKNWGQMDSTARKDFVDLSTTSVKADWSQYIHDTNPTAARISPEEVDAMWTRHTVPIYVQGMDIKNQQDSIRRTADIANSLVQYDRDLPASDSMASWKRVSSSYFSNRKMVDGLGPDYASHIGVLRNGIDAATYNSLKAGANRTTALTFDPVTHKGEYNDVVDDAMKQKIISPQEGEVLKKMAETNVAATVGQNNNAIGAKNELDLRTVEMNGDMPVGPELQQMTTSIAYQMAGYGKNVPSPLQMTQALGKIVGKAVVGYDSGGSQNWSLTTDPAKAISDMPAADAQFRVDFNVKDLKRSRESLLTWVSRPLANGKSLVDGNPEIVTAIEAMSDADLETLVTDMTKKQDANMKLFKENPRLLVEQSRVGRQLRVELDSKKIKQADYDAKIAVLQENYGVHSTKVNAVRSDQQMMVNAAIRSGQTKAIVDSVDAVLDNPENQKTIPGFIRALSSNPGGSSVTVSAIQWSSWGKMTNKVMNKGAIESVQGMSRMVHAQEKEVVEANIAAANADVGNANGKGSYASWKHDLFNDSMIKQLLQAARSDPNMDPSFGANAPAVIENYFRDQMYGKNPAATPQLAIANTKNAFLNCAIPVEVAAKGQNQWALVNSGPAMREMSLQFAQDGTVNSPEEWRMWDSAARAGIFYDGTNDRPAVNPQNDHPFLRSLGITTSLNDSFTERIFAGRMAVENFMARNFGRDPTYAGRYDSEAVSTGQFGMVNILTAGLLDTVMDTRGRPPGGIYPLLPRALPGNMQYNFAKWRIEGADKKSYSIADALNPVRTTPLMDKQGNALTPNDQTDAAVQGFINTAVKDWAGRNSSDPNLQIRTLMGQNQHWVRNDNDKCWELYVQAASNPGPSSISGEVTNRAGLLKVLDEHDRPIRMLDSTINLYRDMNRQLVRKKFMELVPPYTQPSAEANEALARTF